MNLIKFSFFLWDIYNIACGNQMCYLKVVKNLIYQFVILTIKGLDIIRKYLDIFVYISCDNGKNYFMVDL